MQLPHYVAMLADAEHTLAQAHLEVADGHPADADVVFACRRFAGQCLDHAADLAPVRERYPAVGLLEPERLHPDPPGPARTGPVGLLRDLADLLQLATLVESTWELVGQAAQGVRDRELNTMAATAGTTLDAQLAWLRMRMRSEASQALLVAN